MTHRGFAITEPGSKLARSFGCTCAPQPGGRTYRLTEDCPLHTRRHAFVDDRQFHRALAVEDLRERERAARAG